MDTGFKQTSLADINIVRQLVNTLGGGAKKGFGQNFLVNQGTLYKFIDTIHPTKRDIVIEIGPGIGVISYSLSQKVKHLLLIEIDREKEDGIKRVLENSANYEIIWEDASKIDFKKLINQTKDKTATNRNVKIIGSLPYNVAKRIIYNLVTSGLEWSEASFFLQKEVADSYVSVPPQADFLGVFIRVFADIDYKFGVPPEHFFPIPKVKTGVVHLSRHDKFNHLNKREFAEFIKKGFLQPRKTILNNLKTQKISAEQIESIEIKKTARPSELSLEEWEKLYSLTLNII